MGVSNQKMMFEEMRICPTCGEPLTLKNHVQLQEKMCPTGDIRFVLRKTSSRWYISIEVPRPLIRIKETGKVFNTQVAVAAHIRGHVSVVNECLQGKRKSHKGFTFERVFEWELP